MEEAPKNLRMRRVNMTPLHVAETLEEVEELLQQRHDPNSRNAVGMTPLFYAETKEIIDILLTYGADIHARDEAERTALFSSRPEVTEHLVKCGADPNAVDFAGQTALFWADTVEKTRTRLAAGCHPNLADKKGMLPFYYVDDEKILSLYHEAGADFSHKNGNGETAFEYMKRCGVKGKGVAFLKTMEEKAHLEKELCYNGCNNDEKTLRKI